MESASKNESYITISMENKVITTAKAFYKKASENYSKRKSV